MTVQGAKLRPDAPPLTAREVARLCAVELKTVHNWVAQGLLRHFRTPGRHLRFQPTEVRRFLEGCGYEPSASSQHVGRVLVLAKARRHARLRRALSGCDLVWTTDAYAALVIAGRERPAFALLDAPALPSSSGAAIVRALLAELSRVRVVWLGAAVAVRSKRLSVVGPADYDALTARVRG